MLGIVSVRGSERMGRVKAVFAAVAVCAGAVAPAADTSGQGPAATGALDQTRSTLGKWVETQQIISREKKAWQQDREILQSRIAILSNEIAQLQEKMGQVHADSSRDAADRSQLAGDKDEIRRTTSALTSQVGDLESKVRRLGGALPPSMREKVQPLFDRMPAEGADAGRVTLAERFQNVLGILNEMNRINGEITVATEIRPLSDGKPSEVKTIYIGLGTAYFVSARGEAGVGHPGDNGWVWEPANELAPAINEVLEILGNKISPRFVPLPAVIR